MSAGSGAGEGSVDEPLDFAAFDVNRIRAGLEGTLEERSDDLGLAWHRFRIPPRVGILARPWHRKCEVDAARGTIGGARRLAQSPHNLSRCNLMTFSATSVSRDSPGSESYTGSSVIARRHSGTPAPSCRCCPRVVSGRSPMPHPRQDEPSSPGGLESHHR
jgi:hypothetical protein